MHFTPTSDSWLDLVNRFVSRLTTHETRRGSHRSVRSLAAAIMAYNDDHNDNAEPVR